MLRDEIARYTELSGNDGEHTPIGIIGAFLDGYETGLEDISKREWIPVSKRLPEIGHVVYCQLTNGSHEILFMDDFDGQMTWIGRRAGTYNVIAWREMPEPYKAESEGV